MTSQRADQGARTDRDLEQRLQRLLSTAEAIGGAGEQRREILVETAESRGLSRPQAEQAYDIAREEGLAPSLALSLLLEGLSVQLVPAPRPAAETTEPNEPDWVDAPPDPEGAARERRLRQTFRRLRSHFDETDSARGAISAFAADPDLEPFDY